MSNNGDQAQGNEGQELEVKSSVDMEIVGENIVDIAHFTVEKYEFRSDRALPADVREEAINQIKDRLWQKVEQLRKRRKMILADMFSTASQTLEDVINK